MAHPRRTALVVLAALIALGGAGCAATDPATAPAAPAPTTAPPSTAPPMPATPATPTPAPPSPAAGNDLARLLIQPADIPIPGFLPPTVQPLAEDAIDGLVAYFDTAEGDRQLGVTIVLLPDPAAAQDAMLGAASSTRDQRSGARSAPAEVGDRGVIFTGYELAGTASTLLLFSQGTASVAMDFRSESTDPIPTDAVVAAGIRQAALLQTAFG